MIMNKEEGAIPIKFDLSCVSVQVVVVKEVDRRCVVVNEYVEGGSFVECVVFVIFVFVVTHKYGGRGFGLFLVMLVVLVSWSWCLVIVGGVNNGRFYILDIVYVKEFSGKNSTLWPWRPGLESQQPHRAQSKEGSRMSGGKGEEGWRYTWEAQSHIPTIRLMVFPNDKTLNPSLQCHDLSINLHSSHSFLTLTASSLSLRVPLPAVMLDADSPVTFRPLSDHIEVKLLLLLPVDHPILSSLHPSPTPLLDPLIPESDVKKLSSAGEVDFYCRTCTFKLTKIPLR
ncbi:hypothetical protein V8G54_004666 [Vigna mungo]|uniref:Uncharacterized protein n=1 Tax=Vigna mungo TaxID=3915 RepID=A0AAQ3PHD8_VIGMU